MYKSRKVQKSKNPNIVRIEKPVINSCFFRPFVLAFHFSTFRLFAPLTPLFTFRLMIGLLLFSVHINTASAEETARLRTTLNPVDQAWVGQRVVLNVDLMSTTWFSGGAKFSLPEIPGVVLLKVGKFAVNRTERINGITHSVQGHEFALFIQRPGVCTIPPFEVRFASARPGADPLEHIIKTTGLRIKAQMPPGAENLQTIISTGELEVEETWEPQPETAKVGDAFTRRITMRAADVLGMAFPPLPVPKVEGMGVYPREPVVQDKMERGDFTGERIEALTYVCEQPGTVTLPALNIYWWNLAKKELKKEELPSVTLEVAPNPLLEKEAGSGLETYDSSRFPGWLTGFVVLFIIISSVLWKYWPTVNRYLAYWRASRAESEAAYFKRFGKICRSGDAVATMREMTRWLDRSGLGGETGRLDQFVSQADESELSHEVRRLESLLFGKTGAGEIRDWSGKELYRAVKKARQKLRRKAGRSQLKPGGLPGLNA